MVVSMTQLEEWLAGFLDAKPSAMMWHHLENSDIFRLRLLFYSFEDALTVAKMFKEELYPVTVTTNKVFTVNLYKREALLRLLTRVKPFLRTERSQILAEIFLSALHAALRMTKGKAETLERLYKEWRRIKYSE